MRDHSRVALAWRGNLPAIPPLSREEELALFAAWRAGDSGAADRLLRSGLPYMLGLALPYARRSGIDVDDLLGEATLGFMKALSMFDPERGNRLLTYATDWIRNFIEAYVKANVNGSMDMTLTEREQSIARDIRATGCVDAAVLERRHHALERTVSNALAATRLFVMRLDAPCFGDEGATWIDRLVDDSIGAEAVLVHARETTTHFSVLEEALATLQPMWREVLLARQDPDPPTYEKLGERFERTKQRMKQVEQLAMWKVTRFVSRKLGIAIPEDIYRPQVRTFVCTLCSREGHERRYCPDRVVSSDALRVRRYRKRRADVVKIAA